MAVTPLLKEAKIDTEDNEILNAFVKVERAFISLLLANSISSKNICIVEPKFGPNSFLNANTRRDQPVNRSQSIAVFDAGSQISL